MSGGVLTVAPTHTDSCPYTYWFTRWKLSSWWRSMQTLSQSVLWKLESPQQNCLPQIKICFAQSKTKWKCFLTGKLWLVSYPSVCSGKTVPQGLLLSLISFYWWCPYCRYSPGHRATEGKAVFGTQLLCTALAAALTLNQLKIFPHSKTDNYF